MSNKECPMSKFSKIESLEKLMEYDLELWNKGNKFT